jgi:hypothetical protein
MFLASIAMITTAAMLCKLEAGTPLPISPGIQTGGSIGTAAFADRFGKSIFGDKVATTGFFRGAQAGYNWQLAI